MHRHYQLVLLIGFTCALLAGCSGQTAKQTSRPPSQFNAADGQIDPEQVRNADYSILFVGNSHTMMHQLPDLVCDMILFRHPDKQVVTSFHGVSFLEDAPRNGRLMSDVEANPWKFVVLQAQQISMSGKREYSRTEGIDLAKLAKGKGANVLFFAEWGRKGVTEEGPRTERIYREMAEAAGARVSPIGRAWDVALTERPELELHGGDGNHQSEIGAFLTACILYASITGDDPAELATFPYEHVKEADRKFLADVAARVMKKKD